MVLGGGAFGEVIRSMNEINNRIKETLESSIAPFAM